MSEPDVDAATLDEGDIEIPVVLPDTSSELPAGNPDPD